MIQKGGPKFSAVKLIERNMKCKTAQLPTLSRFLKALAVLKIRSEMMTMSANSLDSRKNLNDQITPVKVSGIS